MALDFGPLKTLIDSDDITEVMINAWNKVYVEHKGLLVETSAKFVDARQFEELIFGILSEDKKNVKTAFSFDGVLKNGYRYNITLPPMAPRGPVLTIRKFAAKVIQLDDLVATDFLSDKAAKFLKAAVQARLSFVISGGTGSGKTSFLGALASLISFEERVVSIEDVPELKINHPNWIALQAAKTDTISVTTRDCLVNSLRMRPDRIIVGECRKDETFEMLQAMNSGHEGSLTTVHSNSPSDCLSRFESLIQTNGIELPLKQIRYQMSKAIDIIVQIRRRPTDGKREISEIVELTGMDNDNIMRATIFERNKQGQMVVTGYVPKVLSKINHYKPLISNSFFTPAQAVEKKSA
ncbi:MAG: CpaF family protein [Pseudobdellovibrio sp.]